MKPVYKRVFLNPDKGMAAMSMAYSKEKEATNSIEYSATVEITDCNRLVRMDFDFWTPKMKRDKLNKLTKMIGMLQELQKLMVDSPVKKF